MFWFFVPVVIVALIVAVVLWIYVANSRRRGGDVSQNDDSVRNNRPSTDAPPA